jgi:hypothetical protein
VSDDLARAALAAAGGAVAAHEERLRADPALAADPDGQRRLGTALGRLAAAELLLEQRAAGTDGLLAQAMDHEAMRLASAAAEAILPDGLPAAQEILALRAQPSAGGEDELRRELARRRFAAAD